MDYFYISLFLCCIPNVKGSENIALGKPVYQSSQFPEYNGTNRANDGNHENNLPNSCILTSFDDPDPHWQVNLLNISVIEGINITYRAFRSEQMSGFKVFVSNNTEWRLGGTLLFEDLLLNPQPIQYIPAPYYMTGQYVTYEDNILVPGEDLPLIELCELEVFGCPVGFYGNNCSMLCPENCLGGACNPESGNCTFGCTPTWLGDMCDRSCMNDTWGTNCSQECYCAMGTCDKYTGYCPYNGTCRAGYMGPTCDQVCYSGLFGENCNTMCNCLNGTCDPVNGSCPDGLCLPGWKPDTCSNVCDYQMYGPNCNYTCGYCYGGVTCNHMTGECNGTCDPGWSGPLCKEQCQDNEFGMNCIGRCHCRNGTCDPMTGYCPGGKCERGWNGTTCSEPCTGQSFGYNCEETCHCLNDAGCHASYGICPGSCAPGYRNYSCHQVCEINTYGINCVEMCGHCRDNETCYFVNGTCLNGCMPGYMGDGCKDECDPGTFGDMCTQNCFCETGFCDHITGMCQFDACQKGYMGPTCSDICPPTQFDHNCLKTCHCRSGSCNAITGVCQEPGCNDGWQGLTCSDACDAGYYGMDCNQTCGDCMFGANCNHISGYCPGDCNQGVKPPMCMEQCDPFTYGINCAMSCGDCANGVTCDPIGGVCPGGCGPGWQGLMCKTPCTTMYFGENCNQMCNCKDNVPCQPIDGYCPNGQCAIGWRGTSCDEKCPSGTFSYNCSETCHCLTGFCDPVDPLGICPNPGCNPGWQGEACNEVCSAHTFGPSCSLNCGNCFNGSTCDHISGVCALGCSPGYTGLLCVQTCDAWTFGQDCSSRCGYCYRDAICNPIDGSCPNEGKCQSGWMGPICMDACPSTRYGQGCASLCSEFCKDQLCDRFNGSCINGCLTGYYGSMCTDQTTEPTPIGGIGDEAKLAIYIIVAVLFLASFFIILCCLRNKVLKERKSEPVAFNIEDHAKKAGVVPYQDITAQPGGSQDVENGKTQETSFDSVPTNDQAKLVDNQQLANDSNPDVVPIPAPVSITIQTIDNKDVADKPSDESGNVDNSGTEEVPPTEEMKGQSEAQEANTYGFAIPALTGTRIALTGFATTIKEKKESGAFADEFKNLPNGAQRPTEIGSKEENKDRNRFRNILPYDHSRVELTKGPDGNDYINASFIDGLEAQRQYIAAQGPKDNTVGDFWKMIWENNCGKVVMLANVIEMGKPKCFKYWPNVSETTSHGDYTITNSKEKESKSYTIREITLSRTQDPSMAKTVHHIHFTTWPDHGTPSLEQLINFHSNVNNLQTSLQGPMVVHCSAGVGRTGTFIGLDAMMKEGKYVSSLDVYEYTLKMRKDRMNMIQTVEQYICLHEALSEGLPNATS